MARWATRQTISASSFCLVAPLPFTLSPTLLTPVSQRTQVRFLLVKLETKIIQDFRLPRYSWKNWSLFGNQVLLQSINKLKIKRSLKSLDGISEPGCDEYSDIQIFSDTNIHSYDFLIQIYSDIRSYDFFIQIYSRAKCNLRAKKSKS